MLADYKKYDRKYFAGFNICYTFIDQKMVASAIMEREAAVKIKQH